MVNWVKCTVPPGDIIYLNFEHVAGNPTPMEITETPQELQKNGAKL